jgi:hypothetical protein
MEMFVIPIVLSLGVCHGHLDLDNRGVRFEDYDREVKNILKIFGFSDDIASMGLCVFTHHHTLRIEAEKICHTRFSVAPAGLALIGKEETPFPFDRSMLRSLTIHFNGETLSESNTPTFINLANAIDNVGICFPNLDMLSIDIEWDINEIQERFAPLYTVLHEQGGVKASENLLANIRSAHKSCKNFFKLLIELHYLSRSNLCTVRILSKGKQAVLTGVWDADLIVAGWLFPDSYAWRIGGFRDWVRDYTKCHYVGAPGEFWWDVEPIAIEVLHPDNDEHRVSEVYDYHFDRAGALTWAAEYPGRKAKEEAQISAERALREAQDLIWVSLLPQKQMSTAEAFPARVYLRHRILFERFCRPSSRSVCVWRLQGICGFEPQYKSLSSYQEHDGFHCT